MYVTENHKTIRFNLYSLLDNRNYCIFQLHSAFVSPYRSIPHIIVSLSLIHQQKHQCDQCVQKYLCRRCINSQLNQQNIK